MAKRELSSTLKNLKFMQRAAYREEKTSKKEDDGVAKADDSNFFSPATVTKRCVVIMEGDPHPGAVIGRMSFQSFNPSVDKMNGIAADIDRAEVPSTSSSAQQEKASLRENALASNEEDGTAFNEQNTERNGDLKRKQSEVTGETQYTHESQRNGINDQGSSASRDRSPKKRPKAEKLDWSILRPSKGQKQ